MKHVSEIPFCSSSSATADAPSLAAMHVTHDEDDIDALLELAASLEGPSEHPLASAVRERADDEAIEPLAATDFETHAGRGVTAVIEGARCIAGNADFLAEEGVGVDGIARTELERLAAEGKTPLLFARNGWLEGVIACADELKETSAEDVTRLHEMGCTTVMLTGDAEATARAIAGECGIDEVRAQMLPADKDAAISELSSRGKVAMVGDGINDAPALARADTGIAVGAGTDIAIESADIVLVRNDLRDVAVALALSRATMRNIRQNLFWALIYNTICIPVAAGVFAFAGVALSPWMAAACMSCSSLFVVTNALRLRGWGPEWMRQHGGADSMDSTNSTNSTDSTNSIDSTDGTDGTDDLDEGDDGMKVRLNIEGMMCEHCVAHATEALEGVPGVTKVKVKLADKSAVVRGDDLDTEALIAAVKEAGYEATVA